MEYPKKTEVRDSDSHAQGDSTILQGRRQFLSRTRRASASCRSTLLPIHGAGVDASARLGSRFSRHAVERLRLHGARSVRAPVRGLFR